VRFVGRRVVIFPLHPNTWIAEFSISFWRVEKPIDAHRVFPQPGLAGGPITSDTDDGSPDGKNGGWQVGLADIILGTTVEQCC
jgi:hypothetical protein